MIQLTRYVIVERIILSRLNTSFCNALTTRIIEVPSLITSVKMELVYRNASNKRPGRLLNFCECNGSVYSRGAFKRRGRLLVFFVYQAVPFPLIFL